MYFFKTPFFFRLFFPKRKWGFSHVKNEVYLTFDDGPHPDITPWILDELKNKNIKACFFCVGANVQKYPQLFLRIKEDGHQVGNHSMFHNNSFKTNKNEYLNSILEADKIIQSKLFRPPYGRLQWNRANIISKKYTIIMWTWLSYDFDISVSLEKIKAKAKKIKSGSIIVLHDNPKISERQKLLLPEIIALIKEKGFTFGTIPIQ